MTGHTWEVITAFVLGCAWGAGAGHAIDYVSGRVALWRFSRAMARRTPEERMQAAEEAIEDAYPGFVAEFRRREREER